MHCQIPFETLPLHLTQFISRDILNDSSLAISSKYYQKQMPTFKIVLKWPIYPMILKFGIAIAFPIEDESVILSPRKI